MEVAAVGWDGGGPGKDEVIILQTEGGERNNITAMGKCFSE